MELSLVAINQLTTEIVKALKPRFDAIDENFLSVNNRFNGVDNRFTDVENRISDVDNHIENVSKRFDDVDKRFDRVDNNLERVAIQCVENGKSIDKINKKIDRYYEFEKDGLAHERILKEHTERMSSLEKNVETVICALRNNEVGRQK